MSIPALTLILLLAGGLLLALLIYWLFFLTEGAYLGRGVVVWLYDRFATRYDRIKQWSWDEQIVYLAEPFADEVGNLRRPPLILDVAAGTGQLTRAVDAAGLLPDARWVLLDASGQMLAQARQYLAASTGVRRSRVVYLCRPAAPLPFADDTFDVVACLEALEFMPDPAGTVAELARVLRPGGLLVVTNRIGWNARLLPGRVWSHAQIYALWQRLGLRRVFIRPYLLDYEWVSACKAGQFQPPGRAEDAEIAAFLDSLADLG